MKSNLIWSLVRLGVVGNARKPAIRNRALTIPSFFAGWIATEGAVPLAVLHAARSVRNARRGAYRGREGRVAAATDLVTLGGLSKLVLDARRTDDEFVEALSPYLGAEELAERPRTVRYGAALPVVTGGRTTVRERRIGYVPDAHWRNMLDVYLPKASPAPTGADGTPLRRPAIVEIHGGGWVVGNKDQQGVPLLHHMVRQGWVGFNINYRLAPRSRFPTQLVDCKRALAYIRANADRFGIDPDFVCVTGGSAGGHLCALVALTANDPEFQPGFEDADTTVAAAVPFYGVYDLADEEGVMVDGFVKFIEQVVVGSKFAGDEERWRRYSPVNRVRADAPPTMIVHGSVDTLVPVEQGRTFARRMAETSEHAVVYAELAGANHAFDIFPSTRSLRTVEYVERFLTGVREGRIK
ncbi:MAG: alpha/beta hydrolase [Microthrixaceae bacterium]